MTVARKPRLRVVTLGWAIGAGLVASVTIAAETPAVPSSASAAPATFRPTRPYWIELTVAQREALTPLADDWERLDLQTKKKWVEIANRFPRMTPDEQGRSQQRMREWALLTPDQRRVARDSFARVRAMNAEQRADMLRKYQELPPDKKQALASEGRNNKVIVVPKPMPTPVPRRVQIGEGARVANPAVAAQKSVSPPAPVRVAAPALPAAVAAPPAVAADGTVPAATATGALAAPPASSPATTTALPTVPSAAPAAKTSP